MITMGSIQSGDAQILTYNGAALALAYTNSQVLVLLCQTHDVYFSYSEGGLQQDSTRWKMVKGGTTGSPLIIPLPNLSSGILYFASANAGVAASVSMWQM